MITRYRLGETLVIGWALIGISLVILYAFVRGGVPDSWLLVAILIGLLAWLIAIRPAVQVHEHALVIQNIFRKHEIPWVAIADISATLLLTVVTEDGRKISAWAISSSGRSRMRREASKADEIVYELENYRIKYAR